MKNKIIYLPIENLDMRYTTHMNLDVLRYLETNKIPFYNLYPVIEKPRQIKDGMFLDASYTSLFKSKQLQMLTTLYHEGSIQDGDVIFCADLWFPGIEVVGYLNHFLKLDVKLKGVIHAGSWTDTDFVRALERWAKGMEEVIFDIADTVFVGSRFSKEQLYIRRFIEPKKIQVTPFVIDYNELNKYKNTFKDKENIIIFNGRNCDEKQPNLFSELKSYFFNTHWTFINTQESNLSKNQYYNLLSKSKVVVSFALQENFGFGIQEAVYLGCIPVLPNRLVYPELYGEEYLYNIFPECVDLIKMAMKGELKQPTYNIEDEQTFNKWFEL